LIKIMKKQYKVPKLGYFGRTAKLFSID
jgi:hypothetical protein